MERLHVQVSELQGALPEVPLAEGVDYAALVEGDENPVFLTLPLLAEGQSRNGREYDSAAVRALVQQINTNRPGGILGHLSEQERATRFDLPSLMWVGATMQDGKAWGKAYIPRYAESVREYVLKSKARRSQIATSIYGTATMDGQRVRDLQIESIDLADPTRAGVPAAVAEPVITREMNEDEDMSEELIQELRGQRQQVQEQLDAARQRISELEEHERTVTALRELIPQGDLVENIREMRVQVGEWLREKQEKLIGEAVTAAMGDIAKNEQGAALIREMVGAVDTPEAATARVQELLAKDSIQLMLKALVAQPPVVVGEAVNGGGTGKVDESPAAIAAARSKWGF